MKTLVNIFHRPCNDGWLSAYMTLLNTIFDIKDLDKIVKNIENNLVSLEDNNNILKEHWLNALYLFENKDKWLNENTDYILFIWMQPYFDKLITDNKLDLKKVTNFIKSKVENNILRSIDKIIETDIVIDYIPLDSDILSESEILIVDHHDWNYNKIEKIKYDYLEKNIKIQPYYNQDTCGTGVYLESWIIQNLNNYMKDYKDNFARFNYIMNWICASDIFVFNNINRSEAIAISKYFKNKIDLKDFFLGLSYILLNGFSLNSLYEEEWNNLIKEIEIYNIIKTHYIETFLNKNRPFIKIFEFYDNYRNLILKFPITELPVFEFNELSSDFFDLFDSPIIWFINISTNPQTWKLNLNMSIRGKGWDLAQKIAQFFWWNWHRKAAWCSIDYEMFENIIIRSYNDIDDINNIKLSI